MSQPDPAGRSAVVTPPLDVPDAWPDAVPAGAAGRVLGHALDIRTTDGSPR